MLHRHCFGRVIVRADARVNGGETESVRIMKRSADRISGGGRDTNPQMRRPNDSNGQIQPRNDPDAFRILMSAARTESPSSASYPRFEPHQLAALDPHGRITLTTCTFVLNHTNAPNMRRQCVPCAKCDKFVCRSCVSLCPHCVQACCYQCSVNRYDLDNAVTPYCLDCSSSLPPRQR